MYLRQVFFFLNYISYTSKNTKETQKGRLVNVRHSNKVTQTHTHTHPYTHTHPKIKFNNLNIKKISSWVTGVLLKVKLERSFP